MLNYQRDLEMLGYGAICPQRVIGAICCGHNLLPSPEKCALEMVGASWCLQVGFPEMTVDSTWG